MRVLNINQKQNYNTSGLQRHKPYVSTQSNTILPSDKNNSMYSDASSMTTFGFNPIAKSFLELKQAYNAKNIHYLLPEQIWSDEKILKTVDKFYSVIEKLFEDGKMKPKYLQREIRKILPNCAYGTISVKDFSNAPYINNSAVAITLTNFQNSEIYVKFPEKEHSREDELKLKEEIGHELTHALRAQLQNGSKEEFFDGNFNPKKLSKYFINFYSKYIFKTNNNPIEKLDTQALLDKMDYISVDSLYKDFDKNLKKLESNIYCVDGTYLFDEDKKALYKSIANFASDEKLAYKSSKVFRELTNGKPVDKELKSLLFEEIEKFFTKKLNENFDVSIEDELMDIMNNLEQKQFD